MFLLGLFLQFAAAAVRWGLEMRLWTVACIWLGTCSYAKIILMGIYISLVVY